MIYLDTLNAILRTVVTIKMACKCVKDLVVMLNITKDEA